MVGHACQALLGKQQIGSVSGDRNISVPFAIVFARRASGVRDHSQIVEIYFAIVSFVAGLLSNSTVGANAYQSEIHQVPLAPVPLVEALERNEAGAE